jgi:hypothetical protein
VVGGALFGGIGILVARDRSVVMIQEGIEQRTVKIQRDSAGAWEAVAVLHPTP